MHEPILADSRSAQTTSPVLAIRNLVLACAVALLGLLASTTVPAVTPLSPRLTPQSHQDLVSKLHALGMAPVAHNSVVIALTQVLGLQAQTQAYEEESRYAHLPSVRAQATSGEAGCATVTLRASFAPSKPAAIGLVGTYCPISLGLWQAQEQLLTPEP